jgi:aryl-alcohol dehydrogenase-like predicted oxidoreductase
MGMSGVYGPSDETESIATIHAALDAGINLLDTGDFYGNGHNELLIRDALKDRKREDLIISVKFGALRNPAGGFEGIDNRPIAIRNFLTYTLRRLKTDYVDIYRPARLDTSVPIEDTVGALAELVQQGYIRHIGLSEVGAETIRRANAVYPISDLQIEYSLITRGIEDEILPVCRELGIAITAYGVLSRGLISGRWSAGQQMEAGDFRSFSPRFSSENIDHNLKIVDEIRAIADEKGITPTQLAFAWVLAQGSDIIPLVGARKREQLSESLGALNVELSKADLERISKTVPADSARGDRYDKHQMANLDSEKKSS